jgi:signal transduction histidine kinase
MDIINILILITLSSNILLGYLIYKNNRRAMVNRGYIFVIITILFWGIGMVMYRMSNADSVLLLCKILYVFATFTAPAFLLFSFIFPEGRFTSKKILFIIVPFFLLVNGLTLFTDKIILDAVSVLGGENIIKFGRWYILYVIFFFFHFFYAYIVLFYKIRKFRGVKQAQLKYVFTGYFLAGNLAFGTNLLLPWFGMFLFNWMGQVLTVIMVGFTTYAIIKYRLMNIRLIITRSILYAVLVGAVASFFALSVIIVGNAIGGNTQTSKILTYVINSIIVVIFLDPVKRAWAKVTDNIFYKDKIDYQEVLQEVGNVVAREIDLEKLLQNSVALLADKLKIKEISVLVPTNSHFNLLTSSKKNKKDFSLSSDFVEYLKSNKNFIITEELLRNNENIQDDKLKKTVQGFIKETEALSAEMIIPVVEQESLTAVFLFSAKNSGDLYSDEDLDFFRVFIPQVATAIEKSKLYEEVEEFNRELQAKVEERTKSLQEVNVTLEERNRFLTTMQAVTNVISRTLDLKKVNQMIANSIASELGYTGGILSFINSKDNVLRMGSITDNEANRKLIKMLPKDPHDYETKLEPGFNLGAQTVLLGKINFSDKMSDFLSPPIDKKVIDKIQAKAGIKTAVGVPIFSEAKIIGVIHFLLQVEQKKISSMDIEMMGALTNQVGIVSRNLKLYNNLQKANLDLQEANVRLRELDKAKSEFLSIASHQLRTPISAIKGYLSMIVDGDFGKVPPNIIKVVKDLFESASRLARLINVFLNVSRIESGRLKLEKKPIQISELIDSVVIELINQAKQKGLKLNYKKPKGNIPKIFADSDKLREVVLNLVDNAIKYTPKGKVDILLEFDKENMTFMTKDTGIGIDPREVKSLFRKFVRGSGVAQIHTGGSGLGLFIAQKIIKDHNGKVWAESEGKGKGSTFKFVVPLYDESMLDDRAEEHEDE